MATQQHSIGFPPAGHEAWPAPKKFGQIDMSPRRTAQVGGGWRYRIFEGANRQTYCPLKLWPKNRAEFDLLRQNCPDVVGGAENYETWKKKATPAMSQVCMELYRFFHDISGHTAEQAQEDVDEVLSLPAWFDWPCKDLTKHELASGAWFRIGEPSSLSSQGNTGGVQWVHRNS